MVRYSFIAVAGLAAALPLNINLGAYSPALVVGDGEISFGGAREAAGAAGAVAAPAVQPAVATEEPVVAANAATADPALSEQVQQVNALQGMGKEIAPREEASPIAKRDLSGFDRALTFAEAALQKGPKVQLGTGAGGSGVGIIVDNNQQAAARPGTGIAEGAAEAVVARDVAPAMKAVRAKVTTMYVRSGIPASLQSSNNVARSVPAADLIPASAPITISRRDAIDAVNLNVDGNEGITMTFVETITDEDED